MPIRWRASTKAWICVPITERRVRPKGARIAGLSVRQAKVVVWALGLAPLGRWLLLGFTGQLGANPPEFLIRSSGTFTLVILLVALAVSPLASLTGNLAWLGLRRLCGLFAFFYACLHWLGYFWWDQWFDVMAVLSDAWQRPLIAVGLAAWLVLLALAITSTRGWMRRLGRRWQTLHRGVYVALLLALLHFWLHRTGKQDFADVWLFACIGAILLGWRVYRRWQRSRRYNA